MDIGLNEDFDIALDARNDLPFLEGRAAFEQRLAIRSTAYFHQIVGSAERGNLLNLLRMQAERIAGDTDGAERVVQIETEFSKDDPNTAIVTAIYETGDEFAISLTE